ncbi:zinc-binding dehydrogenase [Palleronia sediminis]|uniref:Zinc-binding dehydrogenase n=1 Tax=Palleronia sediminis TaxID=2547833 RepID=A0A4R6A6S4_9RHOB|nr:alcohol dehydrogenase catalytic domain-containing protein [Palleronia sediminis]TDL79431.1 zinc-binding dehydrogenase [Palleronia sediminis]
MQAILFTARDAPTLAEIDDPRPATGEVVVEMRASGICHTDFEILRGNYGASAFPVVPGHEYAGVVSEIGPGVENVAPGDRVVVDPNIECGTCRACCRGWAHLCEALGAYGVTRNGGFAAKSAVRAVAVHPIGDMPFDVAALAEPMGCVLNGLGAARAERARNALIFGAGPIGLLLGMGLRASGVDDVALVDIDEARLDFAESLGFAPLAAGSPDLEARRQGMDLVADATGVPRVAGDLVGYVANGGSALFFGVCPSDVRIEITPFELFRRQITLAGSHSLNHNIPQALAALSALDLDLSRLVSHRLPLDEIAAVFASGAPPGSLKVQAAA